MIATVVCALACAVLVFAEWRGLAQLRIGSKLVASASFVVLGAIALGRCETAFAQWIFAGLVLGAIGDVALLGHGKRAFLAGLVAFLLGHLAYVVGIAQLEPPGRWLGDAGLTAVLPIAIGIVVLVVLWQRLGSLRVPVIVYVGAIVAMVIGAMAAARGGTVPWPRCIYLGGGATLFFASDLAVARDRFVGRSFANKAWGLPTYFAGQLLIAWSIC